MIDLAPASLPRSLRAHARWLRLGHSSIPALLVHPDWDSDQLAPVVIWMHGRTASKELDPGRYLRWLRAGIGICAVDLPGHGERLDERLQSPQATLDVVTTMLDEIDQIVDALRGRELGPFDMSRMAIGGMSAGGMAALVRLCQPHSFACASVEATTGSWSHQLHRAMFADQPREQIDALDPIRSLDQWREIPIQAIHAVGDEWVSIDGQREFIAALRNRYRDPSQVELIEFEQTGAPHEHVGFGRMAAEAKDRQLAFFSRWLGPHQSAPQT